MNKDAILATVIGFGIGLVITGAVIMGPSLAKALPNLKLPNFALSSPQASPTPLVLPTDSPINPSLLTITTPLAESILSTSEATLSGTTAKNARIVVETEATEIVITADTVGAFSQKITLTEGKNTIIVTAYIDNKPLSQTVAVYYTPEAF